MRLFCQSLPVWLCHRDHCGDYQRQNMDDSTNEMGGDSQKLIGGKGQQSKELLFNFEILHKQSPYGTIWMAKVALHRKVALSWWWRR